MNARAPGAGETTGAAHAASRISAIVTAEESVSYGEFDRRVDAAAAELHRLGVGNGDRVAVVMSNGIAMAVAVYGVLRAGAAFSPISPEIVAARLERILVDVGAAAVITEAGTREKVIAAAPDGTIYVGLTSSNFIIRISPDDSPTVIAGTGSADPGTTAQSGDGQHLSLTPTGLALTPNDGLLISSGHVVYRLQDPANVPPLELGSPLNFFGGGCGPFTAVTGPSSPVSAPASTSCP